ncbi:hypothetical protein [Streptomyces sp. SID3343]|uniref:hypothetical protein n=1 Tax=Streptomyces sp. SID3343 TaxID=2690260 RepID=UPI00136EB3DF|nr:hypothetical protein [Streptomyces sp. SID3343]MYV96984.1 hypothetical protein [Streptomyces sp. SID3343]
MSFSDGSTTGDTGATRYLCTGAEIDERFAARVIEELWENAHRDRAPSYGYDEQAVLEHALAARRRRIMRDVIAFLVPAVLFLIGFGVGPGLLWLATVVFFGLLTVRLGIAGGGGIRDWRSRRAAQVSWVAALLVGVMLYGVAGQGGVLPAPVTVAAIVLSSYAVVVFVAWIERMQQRATVVTHLGPTSTPTSAAGPPPRPKHSPGEPAELAAPSRLRPGPPIPSNVRYSGYLPFVGAGELVASWNFPVELRAAEPSVLEVPRAVGFTPFTVDELTGAVCEAFEELARSEEMQHRLTGLSVQMHEFSSGVTGGPVPPPTEATRRYLCVRVGTWSQEVVVSVLMRFTMDGRLLYTELHELVLPPIRPDFHVADEWLHTADASAVWGSFGRALVEGPGLMVSSAGRLMRVWASWWRRVGNMRAAEERAARNLPVDRGARASVRELGASGSYATFFQNSDAEKYTKLIERKFTGFVLDFLQKRHVDVTEYRARNDVVLNNGIIQNVAGDLHNSGANVVGRANHVSVRDSQIGAPGGRVASGGAH